MASYQEVVLILGGIAVCMLLLVLGMDYRNKRPIRSVRRRASSAELALDLLRHSRPNSAEEARAIELLEASPNTPWWDLNDRYGIDRPQVRDAYLRKLREAL